MSASAGYAMVDVAFLDCAPPDLLTVVDSQVRRGADRVVVIPYFLTLGRHAAKDLPSIVEEAWNKRCCRYRHWNNRSSDRLVYLGVYNLFYWH